MLSWIDIAIILGYVLYSITSGFVGSKAAGQNLVEYFLAGRSLRGWQAGVSLAATQFAADTPLAVAGLIATAGVFAVWRFWVYGIAFLLMALVLGASWRRSGVLTDAGLTEVRYGGKPAAALRLTKAIYFGFVFNCVVLAMVLLAATRITEPFLVWHEWLPAGVFSPIRGAVQWLGFPLTASGVPCPANGMCAEGASCLRSLCISRAEWDASADNVLSIGAIVLVTTLYSTTGGLRAVVRTDMAQFLVALTATFLYAWILVDEVGGLGAMTDRIGELFPLDRSGPHPEGATAMTGGEVLAFTPSVAFDVSLAVLGVLAVQWLCQINADGSGYYAQRMMACRSDEDARNAGVVFTVLQILLRSLVWLPIGLCLLLLFEPSSGLPPGPYTAKAEATFVLGIERYLPPGLRGLMITGMLGALASTVDTHLNWGSSYFTNDVYKRFIAKHLLKKEPAERTLVWVARVSNLVILLIALCVMPLLDSIVTAWQTSLLLGAGVGVLLILRWLWWRMNAWGELAAILSSLILAPIVMWLIETDAVRLLTMASLATTIGVVASLLTPPEDPERLRAFYARARPPGFWGRYAAKDAGEGRRRLVINLIATFGGAASVFCVLVGVGTWLIGAPAPVWFPWREGWIGLNLLVGLGTLPVWVRFVRRGKTPESPSEVSLVDASIVEANDPAS